MPKARSDFHTLATIHRLEPVDENEEAWEWRALGNGVWAELHLLEPASADQHYRIVGWVNSSQEVLINCNILPMTSLTSNSSEFYHFVDAAGTSYGISFCSAEAAVGAKAAFDAILEKLAVDPASPAPEALSEIEAWLSGLSLSDSAPAFKSKGYDRIHKIVNITADELAEMSVEAEASKKITDTLSTLSVAEWLSSISLPELEAAFSAAGLTTLQDVSTITKEKLTEIGVAESSHSTVLDAAVRLPKPQHPEPVSRKGSLMPGAATMPAPPPKLARAPTITEISGADDMAEVGEQPLADMEHVNKVVLRASQDVNGHESVNTAFSEAIKDMTSTLEVPSPTLNAIKLNKIEVSERTKSILGDQAITAPDNFQHKLHVRYDHSTARFEGLPPEWEKLCNRTFGLPLPVVPKKMVEGYGCPIPTVLVMMRDYLFANGGLESEGIFRLAPDQDECATVKEQIQRGVFEKCADINVVANLIKVWMREMPRSLLNCLERDFIVSLCDQPEETLVDLLQGAMPELEFALYLFLLDLMSEVVKHEDKNKMGPRNMAIVMSPNLYGMAADVDPMEALMFSQKVAEFTHVTLKSRLKTFHGVDK
eukprot:GFYU01011428.1.p1 GENE.GFYU01011428.1~~GFYU01011428.1.p1  ORF type:complete len:596 (-),score=168.63 GFYU01011428.1:153-1940(-)